MELNRLQNALLGCVPSNTFVEPYANDILLCSALYWPFNILFVFKWRDGGISTVCVTLRMDEKLKLFHLFDYQTFFYCYYLEYTKKKDEFNCEHE